MFYALGDIHGHLSQLNHALRLIEQDGGVDAEVYFVGDLVDRGPDSRGVIQTLIEGQNAGKPWTCILGNHDLMFHQFVTSANVVHPEISSGKTWLHHRLGGCATLASYMRSADIDHPDWVSWDHAIEHGLDPASPSLLANLSDVAKAYVPQDHLDWIEALPLFAAGPNNHTFVHAGIRPDVVLNAQTRSDLIWIREGWLNHTAPFDTMYVHGHTALDARNIMATGSILMAVLATAAHWCLAGLMGALGSPSMTPDARRWSHSPASAMHRI